MREQSSYQAVVPTLTLLILVLCGAFVLSFMLGRYPVTPGFVMAILGSKIVPVAQTWSDTMETVVWQVRLPRITGAILVGAALASSGAAYQSLFKNPLVSPAILGVSAGAGFGAALGLSLQLAWPVVQALAFAFGLVAVGCAFLIGRMVGGASPVVLVLGGLVISALFQAFISLLQYIADPVNTLPAITFWLMGGLGKVTNTQIVLSGVPIAACCALLYAIRWHINVLGVGDDEARALGINTTRVWVLVVFSATLMTACAVSISGIVGWVGLLIPHIGRMLVGPNFHALLPASLLLGSIYLLLVDNVARTVLHVELPLGILTALIGAPFFIALLAQTRKGWA